MRAVLLAIALMASVARADEPGDLRVMTWNIWHGGREDGAETGPARVAEVIRESGADVIALQETYGSGEWLAERLGFVRHARGENVSILSRFPIVEDASVFEEFKCVGAILRLPDASRVAFYSIWLPYDAEIWEAGTRDLADPGVMLAACRSSARDLERIRAGIADRLAGEAYAGVPVVIAGDFNSMSHLDYSRVAQDQFGVVIDWPTSRVLTDAGFRDAYRQAHPRIDRLADRTWTPRFPGQEQDRIDFVYSAGGLRPVDARVIDEHAGGFPSDHAAVTATLRREAAIEPEVRARVVSYNIRHGAGADDELDLERTARALGAIAPDIVGLQEVDVRAARSGGVNQAAVLGERLGMHAAFGSFMEFQGGWYGMAILSRHPLAGSREIPLPEGNEPRVALRADVLLPTGETLAVVNVHLDWVEDDAFRFAQAAALVEHLRTIDGPYVLLGDFNDAPESRTLELFRGLDLVEAAKPEGARFTFPAPEPVKEIDFIFVSPAARWGLEGARVIEERSASDHRPVSAEAVLRRR